MELAHLPNNTTFLLSKPWKFQFISCSGSKVIPFLPPDRHTDRQMHILHPFLHGQDFFLYGNLYLSPHYVRSFASLTHSLCLWRINFELTQECFSESRVYHFERAFLLVFGCLCVSRPEKYAMSTTMSCLFWAKVYLGSSVTSKKLPNFYKVAQNDFTRKLKDFDNFTKID